MQETDGGNFPSYFLSTKFKGGMVMELGKALQKSIDLYLKNFGLLFITGLVAAILSVVTIGILAGPLIGGFIIMILKLERGEKAEFNEIFAHFDKFIPTLIIAIIGMIISIVIGIIPFLGIVLGFIVGPFINLVSALAIAFVVEKNIEPIDAIKRSYGFFMTNPGINWVYSLIIGILSGIGAIACGIGVIFTLPLSTVGMTIAYLEISAKTDLPGVNTSTQI
jgi:uncharacterized membrane protein